MRLWFKNKMHARNKREAISGFLRLIYFRLVIPVLRSVDQPKLVARGVMMGLALGFTPTVGFQLYLVFIVWWMCRYVLGWNFNLILAMAWSWLSNPVTMFPLYYLYYITGRLLLLDFGGGHDFESFSQTMSQNFAQNGNVLETILQGFNFMLEKVGLSVFVGFLPYSLLLGIGGYYLSFRVAEKYANARRRRFAAYRDEHGKK